MDTIKRRLACMSVCTCLLLHNCTFVLQVWSVSWLPVCLQLCLKAWGGWGVSLCAHYSPLPGSSISLAALRHHPSPHSLYEYLTSPQASLLPFHAFLLFPCFFSYPLSYLFVAAARICLSQSFPEFLVSHSFPLPLYLYPSVCLPPSLF